MMKSEPLISVIVPVYNTAAWLPRCLDSVCAQTYTNLEILCIDDGSTDESLAVLQRYAVQDRRIIVMHQENAGVSAARNRAVAVATGEWFILLDSDDYLHPELIERLVPYAKEGIDIISFGMTVVNADSSPANPPPVCGESEILGMHVCTPGTAYQLHMAAGGKMWRRSVAVENGILAPEGYRHEDAAYLYMYLMHADMYATVPFAGYYYVQRDGSFTKGGRGTIQTADLYLKVIHYVCDWVRRRGEMPSCNKWCCAFVTRVYEDFYHLSQVDERAAVTNRFYQTLLEQEFLPRLQHDYRFRCMKPVRGWRRLFMSRYLNAELWRFLGVPMWEVEYRNGLPVQHRFMLLRFIRCKLNAMFSLFSGRANA